MSSVLPARPGGRHFSLAARIASIARALQIRISTSKITGHIDEARDGVLFGWARESGASKRRLLVDVFIDGKFVGQGLAHLFRKDILEAGLADGRYGFEMLVGAALRHDLHEVRAYALGNQRVELASPASRGEATEIATLKDYLRSTFSSALTGSGEAAEIRPPKSGRRQEMLFARRAVPGPTNYVAHAASRDGCFAEDEVALLKNYLMDYGQRRGRMRAPLAAADIVLLNAGPADDAPLAKSKAQEMFARADEKDDFEAAFVWATYESVVLGVEDCLIPQAHRAVLSALDKTSGVAPFPLSRFMRRLVDGLPRAGALDTSSESQRRLAWLTLALFATAMPHVLNYVPAEWIERFIAPERDGISPFDRELKSVFGATEYSATRWRADIARAGYDLARGGFVSFTARGDRIWSAALPRSNAPLVDVQLIGPFSRRLGISDSCRALAAALQRTGHSARLCDYTLDHPNSMRSVEELPLERPGPARITVLHLNLEDIPAAIAYLPNLFDDTRLIAFPYIELSRLDEVHWLGLKLVDEIWAASRFLADTFASRAPTHLVGTACKSLFAVGRAEARRRAYGNLVDVDDFVFLTAGDALSGVHRKNPIGAIAAFRQAFPDDARVKLIVKSHSRAHIGSQQERDVWDAIAETAQFDSRILLMDRVVSDDEMAALLEGANCLVSLHRAEGFGYHLIEAMKLGTPVIATAYSGNLDFCTPETAFLVDYFLRPVAPGEYPRVSRAQTWAEPDPASAVAALRAVHGDAVLRTHKIAAARTLVDRDFSTEAFAARIASRIKELLK